MPQHCSPGQFWPGGAEAEFLLQFHSAGAVTFPQRSAVLGMETGDFPQP